MPAKEGKRITLGGRERLLAFDYNSFCAIEEELKGENCFSPEFWQNVTPIKLRAILRGALVHETPRITGADVGALIEMDRIEEITQALVEAWNLSQPKLSEKTEAQPPLETR